MAHRLISRLVLALIFIHFSEASVTVEKGRRAILECPSFVPNPEDRYENYATFVWYKARMAEIHTDNRVAVYDKGASSVFGDLQGRATVDGTSGSLEVTETRVMDDHYYSCYFSDTASGTFIQETQLIITVTPSPQNLKISGGGQVKEGESITYTCQASEVKPPPQQMYFRFKDDDSPLTRGLKEKDTNQDGLTWAVAVEYTLIANRIYQGKRLQCVFVTSTGEAIISSQEAVIHVLYKLIGTPSIQTDKESTRVNSAITLTCDTEGFDGIITYYLWQFSDGTIIKNTTESTLEYQTAFAWKFNFLCIAGNSFGATGKSVSLEVEVLKAENPTVLVLGSLLGISLSANLTLAIYFICYCRRNTKKKPSNQSTTRDPHYYSEIDLQQQSAGHPVALTDTTGAPYSYVNSPAQENSVSQGITTSGNGHYTSLQK